jgi:plasmid stabilization system protein ParE
MSYVIRVRPEAVSDIDEQAEYYESKEDGLGRRFVRAVMATIDRLAPMPLKLRPRHGDVRIALVGRFPFGVAYFVEGDDIIVLAVLDLRRNPVRNVTMLDERRGTKPR